MVGLPIKLDYEFLSADRGVSDECKPETTAFRVTENDIPCKKPILFLKPKLVPTDTHRALILTPRFADWEDFWANTSPLDDDVVEAVLARNDNGVDDPERAGFE